MVHQKRVFVYRNQREKELRSVFKNAGKSLCDCTFSLKYDRMMCYTLCNGYKPLAYHDKEGWSRHE